jgi:predicted nucleic acid-binding protein
MTVEFCDTNILVYAYDVSAGEKHDLAQRLIENLWQSGNGVLSIQILQELFVSLTRKSSRPLPIADARAILSDLITWRVIEPTRHDVLAAIDNSSRWKVSFWDALILTAARRASASILWSEDLNHGQDYDGVVARNPFRVLTGS